MSRSAASIAILLATLGGCGTDTAVEIETLEDEGTVCLDRPEPDGPIRVHVYVDACLSSSCDRELEATCQASVEGSVITITSQAAYEHEVGGDCTDDCRFISAECALPAIPDGDYTIIHGEHSRETVAGEPLDWAFLGDPEDCV